MTDDTSPRNRIKLDFNPKIGGWIGPDKCVYDSAAEVMYFCCTIGCGCGSPSYVHQLLIDCLREFQGPREKRKGIDGIKDIVRAEPELVAEFIGHYLNDANLLDHGSSVFESWLTDRGEQFVEIGAHDDD